MVTIQPLGVPRILVSDAATLARYRGLLNSNAASATRFRSLVDAEVAGSRAYDFKPWYAALMSRITGSASYCTFAVSRTEEHVASEEALINANQRADVARDSYLEVGPIIGNVALVYDWCRAQMTAAQRTRWMTYANQAVSNVWNPNTARWGNATHTWTGWSIDNPVNNYYYSFLEATMLLGLATHGENSQAQAWVDRFRTLKLENQLFPTFNNDLTGGGSREGTGYGTAMKNLWRLYDWWERSTGERVATRTPHTLASMAHLQHSIVPTLDRLAPTGDHARDSAAELFDYHRDYLQVLMRLFPSERMSGVAKSLLGASSVPRMANQFMYYSDFLYDTSDIASQPLASLHTTYWGSGTGQLMMRSGWDTGAAYSNFICGPLTESHAHNDQGSFVIYRGNWLAYDANIDSASGIDQGEEMHNLVRITSGGATVPQREGAPRCNLQVLADNPTYTYAVADVTPIYAGHASIQRVQREYLFVKPGTFIVFDRIASSAGTNRIWTLNLPGVPTIAGDTIAYVSGANRLDVKRLAPAGASASWVAGRRVEVADSAGTQSLFLNVLDTDGSMSNAVRSDGADQTGAQVTLADGRSVTVRFNNGSTGGTIAISGSAINGALPTGVQALPLFAN